MANPSSLTENSDKRRSRGGQRRFSDNPVGQRILDTLDGRTAKWLADETGLNEKTVSDYVARGITRADAAIAIADALKVSSDWLLTGRSPDPDVEQRIREYAAKEGSDIVEVAEIDLRYGLGGTYLDNPVETEKREFSRAWLRNFTETPPELLFWTIGDGDSMEPTIRSGEVILIDRSLTTPRFGDGIWAIAYGDIGMIKRLRPLPTGVVEIHSDNALVPPATAADGELHVIGRVVAVVRRL